MVMCDTYTVTVKQVMVAIGKHSKW
jgi:hypothetical protein